MILPPPLLPVVVLAGRFQPFHPGHARSWRLLAETFGAENVRIATSDKQGDRQGRDPEGRWPLGFAEKAALIRALLPELPEDNLVQVRSPYRPVEVLDGVPEDRGVYIAALGEKDAGRLRGAYFQPWPEGEIAWETWPTRGYVWLLPPQAEGLSGTTLRQQLRAGDRDQAEARLREIYGAFDPDLAARILDRIRR